MGDLLKNSPQENPNQDDDDTFTCEICCESISLPNKKFVNGNRCVHDFCTACIMKYIRVKLEENFANIKCPHSSCIHSLEPLSCRYKISHQLFNKWCDALCESTVLEFDRVYCPNKECSELIMNEFSDGDVMRCVCPSCLKPFCYKCKVTPWHEGYTCEETRDGNNIDFDDVCKQNGWNWKRCPRCGQCIELSHGSSFISGSCEALLCYECGKHIPEYRIKTMSDYLCEKLIDEILERLPSKSLLRFRSVCKSWHFHISSPSFIRKHAIRSVTTTCKKIRIRVNPRPYLDWFYVDWSILTDEYTRRELAKFTDSDYIIIGSCFGIICMDTSKYFNQSVILLNPSVRRKLTVPDYPRRDVHVSYWFGFDPLNAEYKIVGLCVHACFVYSTKTNSWSEIQIPATCQFSLVRSYGCFSDGALHWVVEYEINNIAHNYILALNLSTHVFDMISLPKPNCCINKLTIIRDSLALISSDGHETWVWIWREGNDNVASWSNPSNLKSLKFENCQGYDPFTGVHYALVDSSFCFKIYMDICGETLELLDKEPC